MAKRTDDERLIIEMFGYMRPTGSKTEQLFIDRYLTPLGFQRDPFNNLVVTVGDTPRILWSSHVDTVHSDEGFQTLHYDGEFLELSKSAKKTSNCLGADDTAGIWVMTEMIKAGVPGVYVIHDAEESGCIGSGKLAQGNPEFFRGIDVAVAFDRYGYTSIITHQMGRRCCSEAFSASLTAALDAAFGASTEYVSDDGGSYTDTNEYVQLVPECTNISVGYFGQHGRTESQNVPFLIKLRDLMVTADFTNLVIERDPSVVESLYGGRGWGWLRGNTRSAFDLDEPWDNPDNYTAFRDVRSQDTMEALVRLYPDVAAQVLQSYGLSRTTFMDEVSEVYGEMALAY